MPVHARLKVGPVSRNPGRSRPPTASRHDRQEPAASEGAQPGSPPPRGSAPRARRRPQPGPGRPSRPAPRPPPSARCSPAGAAATLRGRGEGDVAPRPHRPHPPHPPSPSGCKTCSLWDVSMAGSERGRGFPRKGSPQGEGPPPAPGEASRAPSLEPRRPRAPGRPGPAYPVGALREPVHLLRPPRHGRSRPAGERGRTRRGLVAARAWAAGAPERGGGALEGRPSARESPRAPPPLKCQNLQRRRRRPPGAEELRG